MKEIIIYVSFLLNGQNVSGTLSVSQDSIRYWDGQRYQMAKTKYFGFNNSKTGIASADKDGQLIVMQITTFAINYSINGKVYHFRRKQLDARK